MNKEPIEAVAWQFLNYDNKEKQYCDIWIDCSKREYDHILQQISDGKTKRLVRELQVISPNTVTISSEEYAQLKADAKRFDFIIKKARVIYWRGGLEYPIEFNSQAIGHDSKFLLETIDADMQSSQPQKR